MATEKRNMEQEFKKFMNNYRGNLAKQRRVEAKERAKTQRLEDALKKMSQDFSDANTTGETPTNVDTTQTVDTDVVEYTYKPGDTFGQVINDLGLRTNNGLWGANGGVAYYTQQLSEQGILDENGNLPIGTTIKLRRRK